jgi:hypothetical protein
VSLADHAANLRALDGIAVRIGWTDPEVARIVAINEAGSFDLRRPPPRPVLLPVADENESEISSLFGSAIGAAVRSVTPLTTAHDGLQGVGEHVEDLIRARIDAVTPDNAPSTIARKGVNAPLRGGNRPGARDRIWRGISVEVALP